MKKKQWKKRNVNKIRNINGHIKLNEMNFFSLFASIIFVKISSRFLYVYIYVCVDGIYSDNK